MVVASKVSPASVRLSTLHLVAVCAAVVGVVLSIAAWWGADPVSDQVNLHPDPHGNSGAFSVQPQPTMGTPLHAGTPEPSTQYPSVAQPAGTDSGVAALRFERPPQYLVDAVRRFQAASANQPPSSPTEQSTRETGRTKSFADAIKAAQGETSAISPFLPAKN